MDSGDRAYRRWVHSDLRTFDVHVGESDLLISAERPLREEAERALRAVRGELEGYLERDPDFATALEPRQALAGAPPVVMGMVAAARACGVGPMAAVAGAVAQAVGELLLAESRQVIVENGGDIFLHSSRPRLAGIYAGRSPLSGSIGVHIKQANRPLGLCTSSGTVGHSLSTGRADAAIVLAESAPLADAAATALGNRVREAGDIAPALEFARRIAGVLGGAVIMGEHLGAWGDIELAPLRPADPESTG
ncbi:MAG: UPF0280 family protein [Armatimonadota bacterium]|nr:MAG: UPF0280 family protein [Armatimonadota bacterium]